MMDLTTATDTARGMLEKGELKNIAEAQVAIVRMMGVRIIVGTTPRDARSALNAGVKAGQIGRLPKDGLKPEAYFHPNAKSHAIGLRNKIATDAIEAIKKVCGRESR